MPGQLVGFITVDPLDEFGFSIRMVSVPRAGEEIRYGQRCYHVVRVEWDVVEVQQEAPRVDVLVYLQL